MALNGASIAAVVAALALAGCGTHRGYTMPRSTAPSSETFAAIGACAGDIGLESFPVDGGMNVRQGDAGYIHYTLAEDGVTVLMVVTVDDTTVPAGDLKRTFRELKHQGDEIYACSQSHLGVVAIAAAAPAQPEVDGYMQPAVAAGDDTTEAAPGAELDVEVAASSDPIPDIALRYRWKRGRTYRFEARAEDRISLGGMGLDVSQVFRTRTEFALHVGRVRPDGSAEAVLEIESFDISDDRGNRVAGLEYLPAGALTNPVDIDTIGRFRFQRMIYLVINEQGANHLVSGAVGPTGASASAQVDGESVTIYAQFDPNTGRLSGGYSVDQVAKKTTRVRVRQDARRIDILPAQLLSLLRLPQSTSGRATFDMPGANTQITVSTLEASEESATLRLVAASDVDPSPAAPAPGAMPGMDGIPDMGGMPGGAGGSAMTLDCDLTAKFDVAEGMLDGVTGTITSSLQIAPMRMDTTSGVSLQRRH